MFIYPHRLADPAEAFPDVITPDQARSWAKLDGEGEDVDLNLLITSALEAVETACEQPIFSRTYLVPLKSFCSGYFDGWYVSTITSVTYRSGGQTFTLDSSQYSLVGEQTAECGLEFSETALSIKDVDKVEITFKAGFEAVPAVIKLAIRFWIARRYDFRDGFKDSEFMDTFRGLLVEYANPHIV